MICAVSVLMANICVFGSQFINSSNLNPVAVGGAQDTPSLISMLEEKARNM